VHSNSASESKKTNRGTEKHSTIFKDVEAGGEIEAQLMRASKIFTTIRAWNTRAEDSNKSTNGEEEV
jgi:hypothetical protein